MLCVQLTVTNKMERETNSFYILWNQTKHTRTHIKRFVDKPLNYLPLYLQFGLLWHIKAHTGSD